jgi:hypothetical protein
MNYRILSALVTALLLALPSGHYAAQRGGGQGQAPPTPRAASPIDLTGHWVSVVTEDWKFRMVTPNKGEYGSVPLNPAGRKLADSWDPARDEAAGNQCKAYGAASIMRVPGHVRIAWENDNVLRVETDAGTQTRRLAFGTAAEAQAEPSWQGLSRAQWQAAGGGRGIARGGTLKVVTTNLKPGYLRKNGVPYSANAVVTEYFDRHEAPSGDQWMVITTVVEDPTYLTGPFVTSTNLRKLPDGAAGWNPSPCSAK